MMRKVDSKGKLFLGRYYAGKTVYVVEVGCGLVVAQDRDLAERVRAVGVKALLDVYYRLLDIVGEPAAEDIERAVEEAIWRDASSTHRS
jgi:H2-forming N5,N10-methylenetetrahydromethanopterin dehydrogenase-like enzyme